MLTGRLRSDHLIIANHKTVLAHCGTERGKPHHGELCGKIIRIMGDPPVPEADKMRHRLPDAVLVIGTDAVDSGAVGTVEHHQRQSTLSAEPAEQL